MKNLLNSSAYDGDISDAACVTCHVVAYSLFSTRSAPIDASCDEIVYAFAPIDGFTSSALGGRGSVAKVRVEIELVAASSLVLEAEIFIRHHGRSVDDARGAAKRKAGQAQRLCVEYVAFERAEEMRHACKGLGGECEDLCDCFPHRRRSTTFEDPVCCGCTIFFTLVFLYQRMDISHETRGGGGEGSFRLEKYILYFLAQRRHCPLLISDACMGCR